MEDETSIERELSPNEIQLDLILADFGKVSDGKLDLMGAGWSNLVGPHLGPCCLAVMAKVPASWAGQELHLVLELLDEDGQLVGHAPRLEIKGVNPKSPKPGVRSTSCRRSTSNRSRSCPTAPISGGRS